MPRVHWNPREYSKVIRHTWNHSLRREKGDQGGREEVVIREECGNAVIFHLGAWALGFIGYMYTTRWFLLKGHGRPPIPPSCMTFIPCFTDSQLLYSTLFYGKFLLFLCFSFRLNLQFVVLETAEKLARNYKNHEMEEQTTNGQETHFLESYYQFWLCHGTLMEKIFLRSKKFRLWKKKRRAEAIFFF